VKKIFTNNRDEWRLWLEKNHAQEREIWLVYYKKHIRKQGIAYVDSVKEAICFGWIDGLKKKIDDETYAYRFTPRKKHSKWSPLNIKYAEMMIKEGKMTKAGLQAFDQKENYEQEIMKAKVSKEIPLSPEIEKALKENKRAWENFNKLAPGYKKQYAGWLVTAKKVETRKRRIKEAIRLLEKNQKLGMK